MEKIKEVDKGF